MNIEIINLLGQVVLRKSITTTEGLNEVVIPVQGLAYGAYSINIETKFGRWSETLIRN